MPLVKYNPFPETEEFPTGLRMFQDTVNHLFADPNAARPWSPAVDIFETENDLVLKADVPGINAKDIEVNVENGTLSLKGERKFNNEKKENGYHRVERGYGSFTRYFTLADSVDTEHVKAEYNDGVLTVTLPKKEIAKPRSIKVQISNN